MHGCAGHVIFLLVGLRSQAHPGTNFVDTFGEELLGIISGDGGKNHAVLTIGPVSGGSDLVVVRELERVDDTDDFIKVTTSAGRVGDSQAKLLVGINNEDGANGLLSLSSVGSIGSTHTYRKHNDALNKYDTTSKET